MKFEPNTIYHIFNQGNNREPIFFQDRNYHFFLGKMKKHLAPYGDLICYCLMPNHFHWLFYTNELACLPISGASGRTTPSRPTTPNPSRPTTPNPSRPTTPNPSRPTTRTTPPIQRLNRAIGTLLSSYTRAVNIQENRSGSLFRAKTKARNGWVEDFDLAEELPPGGKMDLTDNEYARQCFVYIHQNPVKAGLVPVPEEWPYSSACEYAGKRKESFCNLELGKKLFE